MNFKYRLREQEEGGGEENGLKQLKAKTELILTALGDYTADKLVDVINDPSNLKGTFVLRSEGLKELERKVFGDTKASNDVNKNIYQENGGELYSKIFKEVGGFKKGTPFFKKSKTGDIEFYFPEKNKYNLELIKKYFDKTQSGEEKSVRSSLNPVKADDMTLKFQPKDEAILSKILRSAKLTAGKDYDLSKQKSINEELYNSVKEQLLKLLKK